MSSVFKPIRPKKIYEEIIDQIIELISSGTLHPGDRIPSERELASALGVSRPSVREALTILEAKGFIESRQGGGTFVRSLTEDALANPLISLMEEKSPRMLHALAEVRMALETWSAYMAAKRATDEDIARLRRIYETMEEQGAYGGWDPKIDGEFHYAITDATHNVLQVHVLNTIHSVFHATVHVALTDFYQREGYVQMLLKQHRDIVEAIEAHDPERAREKMMVHLTLVEEKMSQLLNENGI